MSISASTLITGRNVTPIETERLILRRYEDTDAAALVPFANDWDIARWIPPIPHPYTEKDARNFIASAQILMDGEREYSFAVTLKPTGTLIGTASLYVASRAIPELGYWIGKPHWAHGYATETAQAMVEFSFATLGRDLLMARVFDGNTTSERVLVKTGFALIDNHEMETEVRGHTRYTVYHRHAG